ncbi:hypothetical protein Glove_109g282 [Diversispora epigaea]|uniref:Uncharacterized protein n=1 Tax=Diversispora epigaea TaxID=1348612 RepID=A0A397J4V4_9GLOM|nr:hypothetical protein Glove_109g282 [Diversispora epigaea]
MDVLFISKNGKVIEELYIPSVVFLTVPIVFTILSSANIETLSILHSNLAGFKFFQAPISTKGINKIFWAACLTIFVEDMPQLVIQVLYYHSVVTYDIIPLLALFSSCLSLLINIIGRLFQAINSCRHGTLEYERTQNQDDFQTPATERNSTSQKSISLSIDFKDEKNGEENNLTKRNSKNRSQEEIH